MAPSNTLRSFIESIKKGSLSFLGGLLLCSGGLFAQVPTSINPFTKTYFNQRDQQETVSKILRLQNVEDSSFTPSQLLNLVVKNHPVAQQLSLRVPMAEAAFLEARGAFDPAVQGDLEQKTFDGINYYHYWNPQLKVPTWFGIEFYAGAEESLGDRKTQERTTGQMGYWGVSIPLAKNLLMDKKRAIFQKARIGIEMNQQEQRAAMNELFQDALESYLKWWMFYQQIEVLNKLEKANLERYQQIVNTVLIGERPPIDTIEALTQLQQIQYLAAETRNALANSAIELSTFLWNNNQPYLIPSFVQPDTTGLSQYTLIPNFQNRESIINEVLLNHPEIKQANLKVQTARIERYFRKWDMLPDVRLKYNFLNRGYTNWNANTPLLENNYKVGLTFSMPLRFSEVRGAYQQSKIYVQNEELGRDQKSRMIWQKMESYYNDVLNTEQLQVITQEQLINNTKLFNGEWQRFRGGESSLFILNSRELKMLETELKYVESIQKALKAKTGFNATGARLF